MNKVEQMIFDLYNNENISVGAHGGSFVKDENHERQNDICNKGLMCRYGDIRRTVALQDRGKIHAHGDIEFEHLIKYYFMQHDKGYIKERRQEGNRYLYETKTIELEQTTFILAIPKEMRTIDEGLFCGPRQTFGRDYAKDETDLRIGRYRELEGRPIDPKYIVGYYMNGEIDSFKANHLFYGFKETEKEDEIPELDLEKIQKVNEETKILNEERQKKSTEELAKETLEKQKDSKTKGKMKNLLDILLRKQRNKTNENVMEEKSEK